MFDVSIVSTGVCVVPVAEGTTAFGVAAAVINVVGVAAACAFETTFPGEAVLWAVPVEPKNMHVASVSAKAVVSLPDPVAELLVVSSSLFAFVDRTLLVEFTMLRVASGYGDCNSRTKVI
jgi:hypothetical protein